MLRSYGTRLSLYLRASGHIPAARTSALHRAGMKGCGDRERESVRPAGGERGDAACAQGSWVKKNKRYKARKKKRTNAVLLIYLSPVRVYAGFAEFRSSRRESGPRLRARWAELRESGCAENPEPELWIKRIRSNGENNHVNILSSVRPKQRLLRKTITQSFKSDYLFSVYHFWPFSIGVELLHGPYWDGVKTESIPHAVGRPASQPMTADICSL